MWLDWISNPQPLASQSDVLLTALRSPAPHLYAIGKMSIVRP